MAVPASLVVQNLGSQIQVFRIEGTSLVSFGNPISATVHSADANYINTNHAIEFGLEAYCWHGDDIYRYNSVTENWDAESLGLAIKTTDADRLHTGLYIVHVADSPTVIGLFVGSDNFYHSVTLTSSGGTWSTASTSFATGTVNAVGIGLIYRNQLVQKWYGDDPTFYDPATNSITNVFVATSNQTWCREAFATFQGDLYCVTHTVLGTTGQAAIYRLAGGTFGHVQDLGTTFANGVWKTGTAGGNSTMAIFTDDTYLYVVGDGSNVVAGTSSFGIGMVRLEKSGSTFTETNLGDTVIPASIRFGQLSFPDTRWLVHVDNDSEGTQTSPVVNLLYRSDISADSTWTQYVFVDFSTELTLGGSGLSKDVAYVSYPNGGGEYIFTLGGLNIEIVDDEPKLGSQEFSYEASGDPVKLRHGAVTVSTFAVGNIVEGASGARGTITFIDTVALFIRVGATSGRFVGDEVITDQTSSAVATTKVVLYHGSVLSGPFQVGDVVTGDVSSATGTVTALENGSWIAITLTSGVFVPADNISGSVSLASADLLTILTHGNVVDGPHQIGETVTGSNSSATAIVKLRGSQFIILENIVGTFQTAENLTGSTTGAVAVTTSAPIAVVGSTGGAADKELRFYDSANEHPAKTIAKFILASASGGTTSNTINVVSKIVADDKATTYTIRRNVAADLQSSGDNGALKPDLSTAA